MDHYSSIEHMPEVNVVFSDFGEEIDDEIALFTTMKTSSNSLWYIVCVPGASSDDPENADEEIRKRMLRVKNLFPFFEDVVRPSRKDWRMMWKNDKNATFIVGPPSIMNETCYAIHSLLRIAPLWHIEPEYFKKFVSIDQYIVMGDLQHPEQSINLTKAIPQNNAALIEQYNEQEEIIQGVSRSTLSIPTNLARNVPMPYELLEKMPDNLKTPLLNTAFEQMVGRVPAHLRYANNISVVNQNTILNYCDESVKNDIIENNGVNSIPFEIRKVIREQVNIFLLAASNEDREDVEYFKRLEVIAMAIWSITGVKYCNIEYFKTFNKENLEHETSAKEKWLQSIKKNNSNLTPCYDLLAVIVKNKGYVPDAEECRAIVSCIF